MKLIFNISILLFSLNTYAGDDDFSVIGRPIQSPLKDQLFYLELKNNDDSTGTCSGVRISNDYVLTAEHCIRDSRGNKREISIDCNSNNLQIENIYESKEFLKTFALSHNGADDLPGQAFSAFDFALIKVKSKKIFVPKFKILKNLADYQSIFLNSSAAVSLNFAENTYCEFHGYGISGTRTSGKLHSTSILSTTLYKNMSYLMKIVPQEEIGQYLQSPFLPEDTKDKDWLYSTVRPGDSGGPIFCKTKN
ncbi:MAG: trypsin-like serine protease, partial [Bacteriovorax sp.]|nr:trypsin-like serine protease [Bacteriovorax sp.]